MRRFLGLTWCGWINLAIHRTGWCVEWVTEHGAEEPYEYRLVQRAPGDPVATPRWPWSRP